VVLKTPRSDSTTEAFSHCIDPKLFAFEPNDDPGVAEQDNYNFELLIEKKTFGDIPILLTRRARNKSHMLTKS